MLTPVRVLWPVTTIVAGGSSFTVSFICDLASMGLLSTKCDDAPQSDIIVNFSRPGVTQPARNGCPMPDGGDWMT